VFAAEYLALIRQPQLIEQVFGLSIVIESLLSDNRCVVNAVKSDSNSGVRDRFNYRHEFHGENQAIRTL
jgi:hypothetical protein